MGHASVHLYTDLGGDWDHGHLAFDLDAHSREGADLAQSREAVAVPSLAVIDYGQDTPTGAITKSEGSRGDRAMTNRHLRLDISLSLVDAMIHPLK